MPVVLPEAPTPAPAPNKITKFSPEPAPTALDVLIEASTLAEADVIDPTLGIEVELLLVDAETMALSSSIEKVLQLLPEHSEQKFKPELMQCCIEINTGIFPKQFS